MVATNCEQSYVRPLVLGDRLLVPSVDRGRSRAEKHTGLGTGHFVTTRLEFTECPTPTSPRTPAPKRSWPWPNVVSRSPPCASASSSTSPGPRSAAGAASTAAPERPPRPRPALTQDNAFFFEGARAHHLLIQRCTSCGTLRHPPRPACGTCRSFEWDTVTASGRGTVYSFVVVHYPQVPAFDYPLAIGAGRAGGGDAARGQRRGRRSRETAHRYAGGGRRSSTSTTSSRSRSSGPPPHHLRLHH